MYIVKIKQGLLALMMLTSLILSPSLVAYSGEKEAVEEPEKGPNNGRMLRQGDFAVELSIFETGVPPEFRVWVTKDKALVSPDKVNLNVKLTRLGGVVDDINFTVENDYLRGDTVIYDPHSFLVTVTAQHQGKQYRWEYENFEGRTTIADKVATAMGINTELAGPATLHQTVEVYGRLQWPPGAQRNIQARFDGEVKASHFNLGDSIKKGQKLFTIESNESLKAFTVRSPINGIVTKKLIDSGEQAKNQTLAVITNTDTIIAELAVYPVDWSKIKLGAPVKLYVSGDDEPLNATIAGSLPQTRSDQAKVYRVKIDNSDLQLSEGTFVTADIEINTIDVPLAVKRTGLQAFRDFTVVYAKVGEQYEVRMLDLGRSDNEWIEVLGGLKADTEYVTDNSFIIKADIEKSGASHDH